MSDSTQEEAHTGPIRTPGQLLLAVFFSFVVPVFVIIGLVSYVVNDNKPAGDTRIESYSLGGMTAQDLERRAAERIRKVGLVEVRDANRELKAGQDVYAVQCVSCHAGGVAGAPKPGDTGAWSARIASGFDALVQAALKGKGAMPPQSGGDFEDVEIARAVAYMANSAGANFPEPQRPAAAAAAQGTAPGGAAAESTAGAAPAAAAPAAAAPAAASPAPTATVATAAPVAAAGAAAAGAGAGGAPAAGAGAAPPQTVAAAGAGGEALYKQACAVCHVAGVANAPKVGDKAAWAPRLQQGVPVLVQSVIKGKGAMPPRGGAGAASDDQLAAAVAYMVDASK